MKLNCLSLDVDTCQLSSFSVPRPSRLNSSVSSALVKTLRFDTSKILFPSPSSYPHIPPESNVCDYKRTIQRLPKASWCKSSLPPLPLLFPLSNKVFFFPFPIPGTSWQIVLISHSQQAVNHKRERNGDKGETKKLKVLMSKEVRNVNSDRIMQDWLMPSLINFFVWRHSAQCVMELTCLEVSFIKEPS